MSYGLYDHQVRRQVPFKQQSEKSFTLGSLQPSAIIFSKSVPLDQLIGLHLGRDADVLEVVCHVLFRRLRLQHVGKL